MYNVIIRSVIPQTFLSFLHYNLTYEFNLRERNSICEVDFDYFVQELGGIYAEWNAILSQDHTQWSIGCRVH